jgi:pantoate--beta-alanine ligase
MKTFNSVMDFMKSRQEAESPIGFIPTMGALHVGHESLIKRSVEENKSTVVSIYVNPTQFDNKSDLAAYPETMEHDQLILESLGVDILLAPTFEQMYPDGFRYQVLEEGFSRELCGDHRDGHFIGVLTVVMKLLNIVNPDKAYFGEKDYQQYLLIRDMVNAFFLDVEIVPCPIVRESDGLALSSRNVNLDPSARKTAPIIRELIDSSASDQEVSNRLTEVGFDVDYVETRDGRRFVAAKIGEDPVVRLIDNVAVIS